MKISSCRAAAFAIFVCFHPMPAGAQTTRAESEIRGILATYVSAWREADYERLGEIFATENGSVMWVSGQGDDQTLASMTFAEILSRERRPQAEYGLEWDVLSLDVVDDKVAVAKLDISRRGGHYTDFLVLYRIAGSWKIVNKTFSAR